MDVSAALAGESGKGERRSGLTKRGVVRASRACLGVLGSGMAAARVERIIERRREGCIVIVCFWFGLWW